MGPVPSDVVPCFGVHGEDRLLEVAFDFAAGGNNGALCGARRSHDTDRKLVDPVGSADLGSVHRREDEVESWLQRLGDKMRMVWEKGAEGDLDGWSCDICKSLHCETRRESGRTGLLGLLDEAGLSGGSDVREARDDRDPVDAGRLKLSHIHGSKWRVVSLT